MFRFLPTKIVYLSSVLLCLGATTIHDAASAQALWTYSGVNPYTTLTNTNVAASAVFTVTGVGAVTINLKNTYSGISASNTDVLEGVLFDLTGFTTDPTSSLALAQVAPGSNLLNAAGGVVGTAGTDLTTAGNWKFKVLGSAVVPLYDNTVHNYGISDTGAFGIATGAGKGGIVSAATYPSGPGSPKVGSANKTPWTDNEAVFKLSGVTGLVNVNQITNVYFIFNSAGTINAKAQLTGTPEPEAYALFGTAMVTGAIWIRKRKRKRS